METSANTCQGQILLVDDDQILLELGSTALSRAGFHVDVATDGQNALDLLSHLDHDLVMTDLRMPRMDGLELIKRIRSNVATENLPVIVITGLDSDHTLDSAYSAGATSFIAKPINWPTFVHHARCVLRSSRQQEELRTKSSPRQKDELVQILRNVPRAVITTDSSGIIRIFNPAAEKIFGYTASETIGHNISLLMPDQNKKHHDGYIRSYLKTGESKIIEVGPRRLIGRHKDGTKFPLELALAVVGKGKDMGFIAVARDITEELKVETRLVEHRDWLQQEVDLATAELKANAEELEHALAKEKEFNKLQRQFVSMASHEFRTPLAIIDATAQRLKSRADKNRLTSEDAVQRVEKIRDAVQRMTRLIESTLDAARMEEGKIKVDIKPCNIGKVVRGVCTRQKKISQTHVISCDMADLPETIQADTGWLEQALTNLLSNAVKYAPDAPDIEVKVRRDGPQVVISVRDHGIGIDEDDLSRIGQRFFRARTSTGTTGTGIGLNLTKTLVEMHGGSVSVESSKGEGSTFTIRLPIAGPDQSEKVDTKVA